MSHPISTTDLADLLEALGRPDAAANLRWGQPAPDEVLEERDDLANEIACAEDVIKRLESLLCRNCAKKWKDQK